MTSDVAFEARGDTLEELFAACAEALLAATVENPEAVQPRTVRTIELEEPEADLLLLAFLNELIYLRDAEGLLLRPREIRIETGSAARLRAVLEGERLDRARHRPGTEVKAATAHELRIEPGPDGFRTRVTLDV